MHMQELSQVPQGAHHQAVGDDGGGTPLPHRPQAMRVMETEPMLQVRELQGGRRS